jgi:hypothetical protein
MSPLSGERADTSKLPIGILSLPLPFAGVAGTDFLTSSLLSYFAGLPGVCGIS